jgi:ketosteroid isomerase-like protein
MMIRKLLIVMAALWLAGCGKREDVPPKEISAVSADTLIQLEMEFSRMSEEKGFHSALKAYMSPEATKLVEGRFPLVGSDSIARVLDSRPDTGFVMTWKARRADISSSGDLGYTWGDWMFRPKYPKAGDTLFGNYFTVWKKQSDGSWKWVLDGGNSTPSRNSK